MYCVRKVVDDLYWVGGNDHRLALFENIHPIPNGCWIRKRYCLIQWTGMPAVSFWKM